MGMAVLTGLALAYHLLICFLPTKPRSSPAPRTGGV
jgi:hypothetical protein